MSKFVDDMLDCLAGLEDFPDCPQCGHDDVMLDNNGEYQFFFCTQMDPECGWESKPGEYGLEVYNDEEE